MQPMFPASMCQQQWNRALCHHVPRNAAENGFAEPRVAVSAHNNKRCVARCRGEAKCFAYRLSVEVLNSTFGRNTMGCQILPDVVLRSLFIFIETNATTLATYLRGNADAVHMAELLSIRLATVRGPLSHAHATQTCCHV